MVGHPPFTRCIHLSGYKALNFKHMTREEKAKQFGDWGTVLAGVSVAAIVSMMISYPYPETLFWIGFTVSVLAFALCGYSLTLNPTRRIQLVFRAMMAVVVLFMMLLWNKFG